MARESELTRLLDRMIERMNDAENPADLKDLALTIKALQEAIVNGLSAGGDDPYAGLGNLGVEANTSTQPQKNNGTETAD